MLVFLLLYYPFALSFILPLLIPYYFTHRSKNEMETFFWKPWLLPWFPQLYTVHCSLTGRAVEFLVSFIAYCYSSNTGILPFTSWLAATSHKVMKWRKCVTGNTNLPDFGTLSLIENVTEFCVLSQMKAFRACVFIIKLQASANGGGGSEGWRISKLATLFPGKCMDVRLRESSSGPRFAACWLWDSGKFLTFSQPLHPHLKSKLLFRIT